MEGTTGVRGYLPLKLPHMCSVTLCESPIDWDPFRHYEAAQSATTAHPQRDFSIRGHFTQDRFIAVPTRFRWYDKPSAFPRQIDNPRRRINNDMAHRIGPLGRKWSAQYCWQL